MAFYPFEWADFEDDDPYIQSFTKYIKTSTARKVEDTIVENVNGLAGSYDQDGAFKEWMELILFKLSWLEAHEL